MPSALEHALARVGDRWSLLVVDGLLGGPRRFADLQGSIGGIATNVLTARLRRLEAEGLVVATPYSHRPPRHTYQLTGRGRELAGALRLLAAWGAGPGAATAGEVPAHDACGGPLEVRWWCPTCDAPAEATARPVFI